jgi:hypothetical protein
MRDLALTEAERRTLAYAAQREAANEEDFRYWHPDPVERERLRKRWREIAGVLLDQEPARPLAESIADAVAEATANPGRIVEAQP